MAFGDDATLISSFTGSDETPLSEGGAWTEIDTGGTQAELKRVGNQLGVTGVTYLDGEAYWNTSKFGPDVEAYVTLAAIDTYAKVRIVLRHDPVTDSRYEGSIYIRTDAAPNVWDLSAMFVSGSSTVLWSTTGTFGGATISDGDKVGFSIGCKTVKGYMYQSGSWTEVFSQDDSVARNYSRDVYVGLRLGAEKEHLPGQQYSNPKLDDFYAGETALAYCPGYELPSEFVPQIYRRYA